MKTFLRFFFSTSTFSKRIKHLLFYTISLLQAKSTTKNTPRDSTSDSELRALPLKTSERSRPTGTTESRSDFQRGFGSSSSKPEPMSSSVKEGPTAATSVPKSSELISSRAPLKSPFRCSLSSQPARTKGRIPLLRRAHHDIGLHSKVYLERLVQRARIPRAVELSPLLADLFFRSVALCRRKRRGRKKVQRRKKKKSDFSPLFSFFRRPSLQSVSLFLCLPSIFSSLLRAHLDRDRFSLEPPEKESSSSNSSSAMAAPAHDEVRNVEDNDEEASSLSFDRSPLPSLFRSTLESKLSRSASASTRATLTRTERPGRAGKSPRTKVRRSKKVVEIIIDGSSWSLLLSHLEKKKNQKPFP